jgi:membrane-bound serine protease (ClpP class)
MALVITLLAMGAVLLLLETLLPGVVAGVAGLVCLIAGVSLSYTRFGIESGSFVFLGVLVVMTVGAVLWVKYFPGSALARPFLSNRVIGDIDAEKRELLDKTGVAQSALRPSGVAVFNGRRVDVITEGAMIEPGTPVKVVQIEGIRVVVRAV